MAGTSNRETGLVPAFFVYGSGQSIESTKCITGYHNTLSILSAQPSAHNTLPRKPVSIANKHIICLKKQTNNLFIRQKNDKFAH